jgi:hypothetical protein
MREAYQVYRRIPSRVKIFSVQLTSSQSVQPFMS